MKPKPKKGAPKGNKNAQKGDEPLMFNVSARLTAEEYRIFLDALTANGKSPADTIREALAAKEALAGIYPYAVHWAAIKHGNLVDPVAYIREMENNIEFARKILNGKKEASDDKQD